MNLLEKLRENVNTNSSLAKTKEASIPVSIHEFSSEFEENFMKLAETPEEGQALLAELKSSKNK